MDKIFLEFPICCLSYPVNEKGKIAMIISYCVVEHSKKINSNLDERVPDYLDENKTPFGFNKKSKTHCKILLAADELGMILGDINYTIKKHELIKNHISTFNFKYGNDSYCRIGKKLLFETRDGQFPYRQFAVLCAVQSILGKRAKFKRITKDRIRFAALGYKSKQVAFQELKSSEKLLTDRQIGVTVDVLHAKKLFSKFTYANRQTFFSTRLDDDGLFEAIKDSKIFWAKKKANLMDKQRSNEIKKKLKLIRFDGHSRTGTEGI